MKPGGWSVSTTFRMLRLRRFQARYGDGAITRDSIFDYVYGVLHSPVYRDRFANDLAKDLPRIPLTADFEAFAEAGKRLAELHLGYETGEEYSLEVLFEGPGEPRLEHYRIGNRAMRFADGEKTILVVNDHIRLGSIPPESTWLPSQRTNAFGMAHGPLQDHAGQGKRYRQ